MEGTPVATRVTTAGVAFPVEPGESVLVPPLATGDVRNDGPEPVVALAVFIGPPTAAMATPGPEATPMAEEAAAGLTFEPLGFGVVDQLPSGPAALVIARVRIAPGVNPSRQIPSPGQRWATPGGRLRLPDDRGTRGPGRAQCGAIGDAGSRTDDEGDGSRARI